MMIDVDAVLAAVFTLTRQSKRDRDKAQLYYRMARNRSRYESNPYHDHSTNAKERKERYYRLKGQALAHLLAEGVVKVTGLHRFGVNYAELLEGRGYRFHRPCPAPDPVPADVPNLGEGLEAKPKKRKELGLRVAIATVEKYLEGRPVLDVYQWPTRVRPTRTVRCWSCGEEGHLSRECSRLTGHDDEDDGAWGGDEW
jgi:hypothetical protein